MAVGTAMGDGAHETCRGASKFSDRRCLACGQVFPSSGAVERICAPCKGSEDWADAMAVTKGHIAW
jgi:hypothetical protein